MLRGSPKLIDHSKFIESIVTASNKASVQPEINKQNIPSSIQCYILSPILGCAKFIYFFFIFSYYFSLTFASHSDIRSSLERRVTWCSHPQRQTLKSWLSVSVDPLISFYHNVLICWLLITWPGLGAGPEIPSAFVWDTPSYTQT